jgi:hypothetical protein
MDIIKFSVMSNVQIAMPLTGSSGAAFSCRLHELAMSPVESPFPVCFERFTRGRLFRTPGTVILYVSPGRAGDLPGMVKGLALALLATNLMRCRVMD